MDVETTFDDPKMYTKPFTIKVPHVLLPDSDIFEMFCNENEKDRAHLQKPIGRPAARQMRSGGRVTHKQETIGPGRIAPS